MQTFDKESGNAMEFNDKKRTRTMYENECETGTKNYWAVQGHGQGQGFAVPPTTPANWFTKTSGSIFNFSDGSRDSSGYQFGNSFGNNLREDECVWEEDGNQEWGEEGEDWEWVCEDCGKNTLCDCPLEVCTDCNKEWNSCYCEAAEGFDSVG